MGYQKKSSLHPKTVVILVINHRHGTDAWAFSTVEKAQESLLKWVEEWWKEELSKSTRKEWKSLPKEERTDKAKIEFYFDRKDDEYYDLFLDVEIDSDSEGFK